MYLLALQIDQMANPIILKYSAQETAQRNYEAIVSAIGPSVMLQEPAFLKLEDDWGQQRALWAHSVRNVGLIDMERDIASQAQVGLWQQRGQAQLNRLTSADPQLKMANFSAHPFMQS